MQLDYHKELTPVLYGDSAVKILTPRAIPPDTLCFSTHWHDRMEILLVTDGSITVCGGNDEKEITAGETALFSPCLPHSGRSGKSGVSYYTLMFDLSKFYNSTGVSKRYLVPLHEQKTATVISSDNSDILSTVKEILTLYEAPTQISDICIVANIYKLIGLISEYCTSCEAVTSPDSGRFKEIIDFINCNFKDDISSAYLSRKFGYDETYFCRKFKSVTGLSPMIYLRILRLENAKKLIKSGSSVSDTAVNCGFSDAGYFSRCFKKHFGISPTEYAQKYRN